MDPILTRFIRLFICLILAGPGLILSESSAQTQQIISASLQGDTLIQQLVLDYKPAQVLTYKLAREAMYTDIDNYSGKISGVYSGFTIQIDTNSTEPIAEALDLGINCEHSYPQSKGASEEPARSNMHHLFPSKININADRGSCPYSEIDDNQTKSWYWMETILNGIPSENIDEYSEKDIAGSVCGTFEPRESRKGDIARALFYFYTMYSEEANSADPTFFLPQKEVLLAWNYLDPVDELEYERTWAIAEYQDMLPNPFVLDSTLARRAYFLPDMVLSNKNIELNHAVTVYPNPVFHNNISIKSEEKEDLLIDIFDCWGNKFTPLKLLKHDEVTEHFIGNYPPGIYVMRIRKLNSNYYSGTIRFTKI